MNFKARALSALMLVDFKEPDVSMMKNAHGFFFTILGGSFLSALLGSFFGWMMLLISPHFVINLTPDQFSASPSSTGSYNADELTRFVLAAGMFFGLFIGAAVSGFACFLAAVLKIMGAKSPPADTNHAI